MYDVGPCVGEAVVVSKGEVVAEEFALEAGAVDRDYVCGLVFCLE